MRGKLYSAALSRSKVRLRIAHSRIFAKEVLFEVDSPAGKQHIGEDECLFSSKVLSYSCFKAQATAVHTFLKVWPDYGEALWRHRLRRKREIVWECLQDNE